MTAAVKISPPDQLLALTHEMLVSAEQGDWERLTELETTRLPLFEQVFAQGIAAHVELVKEILSTDEKTKQLAKTGMSALQQEILKLKDSGQAKNAYQAIQNSATGID
jgi:Flagellar protein FliT